MTSINNFNPVIVGSIPAEQLQIRKFKYFNGNFYYIRNGDLLKISNGSPSILSSTDDNFSFSVNSSGALYRLHRQSGYSYINGTNYSGPQWVYLYDIDISESDNRIYFWRESAGGEIAYWDLNNNSETILFDSNGAYEYSNNYGEQVVRYNNGSVYFNLGKSLFSVQNDGNNFRIISSSSDQYNITGIVVVD